ncbi:aldolase catalytic domain-containing protein [Tsuneonella sp. HG094]
MHQVSVLDCTLRDGGYYNDWNFEPALVSEYLAAMSAAGVDVVELGQRFIGNSGFKGPHAFTTDDFLRSLPIPDDVHVAVMVNGADLLRDAAVDDALATLFPETAQTSPVDIVRVACHLHEMAEALAAADWLAERGYRVGFNLMQIADRTRDEVVSVARLAAGHPVEVLYFADSMGSMTPRQTGQIIGWLREGWPGPIGIHTHDNMGLALQNSLAAIAEGATWIDATVTGMGRGPGNARTEELVIALEGEDGRKPNHVPLLSLVANRFQPMKAKYGWGSNPFYFLSGKYGIHPSYIQEMMGDSRYSEEDIIAVIDHLRRDGGKKYTAASLNTARSFFGSESPDAGTWRPSEAFAGREVLLLGAGPGVDRHASALCAYIERARPVVIAVNTRGGLPESLIDLRVACHPVRLLADVAEHAALPQPLITPFAGLPESVREALAGKDVRDFGIAIAPDTLHYTDTGCTISSPLVASYALAALASGRAARILLAGFDGFPRGDRRNDEMEAIVERYLARADVPPLVAITPTAYPLPVQSVYGM